MSLVSSFLWPGVAVFAIFLFRGEAKALLAKLSELTAGPVAMKFRDGVAEILAEQKEIEDSARSPKVASGNQVSPDVVPAEAPRDAEAPVEDEPVVEPTKTTPPVDQSHAAWTAGRVDATRPSSEAMTEARELVGTAPQFAVLRGFQALELTLNDAEQTVASWQPTTVDRWRKPTVANLANALQSAGVIDSAVRDTIVGQARLRNTVVHESAVKIDSMTALDYLDTIETSINLVAVSLHSWVAERYKERPGSGAPDPR